MKFFKATCAFCRADNAGFSILAFQELPTKNEWSGFCRCGVCDRFSLFEVLCGINPGSESIRSGEVKFLRAYPEPEKARIPKSIPDNVLTPLTEAELAFANNLFSAAGSCYRKSIERATKAIDPEIKGMLNARIRKLEKSGKLPIEMIELLDQVRLFGNEAMHEDDFDPTKEDCMAAREFTNLFLTYTFSLPASIKAAKADT